MDQIASRARICIQKAAMPIMRATRKRSNQASTDLIDSRFGLFVRRRRWLLAGFRVLAAIMFADSDAALSNLSNSARICGVALGAARESVTVSLKISRLGGILEA